jgi:hypothetical protein
MKNYIKITIKLFLILCIFQFVFKFLSELRNFVWVNELIISSSGNIENYKSFDIKKLLNILVPIIIQCFLFIFTIIVLWFNSNNISNKIIGKNDVENVRFSIDYKNILSIGIVILCLYFIIDTVPKFIFFVSDFFIYRTRYINEYTLRDYTIGRIIDMIGFFVLIFLSIIGIKYNKWIINKIIKEDKNKSNGI